MRLDIADINRINTCGILKKNNWDYEQENSSNPSYLLGMKEIIRWHYKRNRPIDTVNFMAFISKLYLRAKISHEEKIQLEKAFREFINSAFYQRMNQVFINYSSDIKINKQDYLEYQIPVFINNKDEPTFLYYNLGNESKNLFLQRYEIMHNAIWSFYHLNRLPVFVNVWFDGKKIKHETIKVNEKYIQKSKKNLIIIGNNLNIFITPPIQRCISCSKIVECERFNEKKRGRND